MPILYGVAERSSRSGSQAVWQPAAQARGRVQSQGTNYGKEQRAIWFSPFTKGELEGVGAVAEWLQQPHPTSPSKGEESGR